MVATANVNGDRYVRQLITSAGTTWQHPRCLVWLQSGVVVGVAFHNDHPLRLYDVRNNTFTAEVRDSQHRPTSTPSHSCHAQFGLVQFRGNYLVAGGHANHRTCIWDLTKAIPEPFRVLTGQAGPWDVAVVSDEVLAISSYGGDNRIHLWDWRTPGHSVRTLGDGAVRNTFSVVTLGSERDRLAYTAGDGRVRVADIGGRGVEQATPQQAPCLATSLRNLAALPGGRIAYSTTLPDQRLAIFDVARNDVTFADQAAAAPMPTTHAVCALPDGRIVTGSDDNCVRVWSL